MSAIRLTVNGVPHDLETDGARPLLWVLRDDLGLTGTKFGCGVSACGACSVLVEGRSVRSCVTPLAAVAGKSVTTIEGLANGEQLTPVQQAFIDHLAFQCGYCTPGMIVGGHALLLRNPHPSREEIYREMEGHLCRCGAQGRIVDAIAAAAESRTRGTR